MHKKIMTFLLSYSSFFAFGSESEFSLGAGFQYSGVVGTQLSVIHQESKYFVSVGLPGYSLGMQTMISDNEYHSVGFSVGEIQGVLDNDGRYGFITYNYHMSGFKSNGWVLGTGVGFYDEDSYTLILGVESTNPSKKAMFTLDIGYKF